MIPTETKHTQGPWHVEHPFGESGVYVAGQATALIAQIYVADSGLNETEANARLIAAAPDLLAACKAMFTAPMLTPEQSKAAWDQARAAISKATHSR